MSFKSGPCWWTSGLLLPLLLDNFLRVPYSNCTITLCGEITAHSQCRKQKAGLTNKTTLPLFSSYRYRSLKTDKLSPLHLHQPPPFPTKTDKFQLTNHWVFEARPYKFATRPPTLWKFHAKEKHTPSLLHYHHHLFSSIFFLCGTPHLWFKCINILNIYNVIKVPFIKIKICTRYNGADEGYQPRQYIK